MKNSFKFIGLCGCIVLVGTGGTAYGNSQRMPDNPEESLSEIPTLTLPFPLPEKENEFAMKRIKPKPGVEYKIRRVIPDSNMDYKIRIVDPRSLGSLRKPNTRGKGFRR